MDTALIQGPAQSTTSVSIASRPLPGRRLHQFCEVESLSGALVTHRINRVARDLFNWEPEAEAVVFHDRLTLPSATSIPRLLREGHCVVLFALLPGRDDD